MDNQLEAYTCQGSMNSKVVIAFLNDFATRIVQPTVVVIDNAPIHHSKEFEAQIEVWKEQDLYLFFLPKYSPHLNPIELLWRMIKYQWLEYEVIDSQDELDKELERILCAFGEEYTINFKEHRHSKKVSFIFE